LIGLDLQYICLEFYEIGEIELKLNNLSVVIGKHKEFLLEGVLVKFL
jgi:hypothetical protein